MIGETEFRRASRVLKQVQLHPLQHIFPLLKAGTNATRDIFRLFYRHGIPYHLLQIGFRAVEMKPSRKRLQITEGVS